MSNKVNTVAIIQARMSSTRLPGKVLKKIYGDKTALECMLERATKIKGINNIVVATTVNEIDNPIIKLCEINGIDFYQGDEKDVLGRFYHAAKKFYADNIVRLTADCPMLDPSVVDTIIDLYKKNNWDYVSNTVERTFPDGLDAEIFSYEVLEEAFINANEPDLREHVTLYINGKYPNLGFGQYKVGQVHAQADFSHIRWTLDTEADLNRIRTLFELLPEDFTWLQALSVASKHPELLKVI